jgi:F0F1-type ATP synthase assembly protein I
MRKIQRASKNRILAFSTIGLVIAGFAMLTLDSPYWLISALFFVVAVLIPLLSIMWKISCWVDYQIQKFLNHEEL